jgi:hypothetical protein
MRIARPRLSLKLAARTSRVGFVLLGFGVLEQVQLLKLSGVVLCGVAVLLEVAYRLRDRKAKSARSLTGMVGTPKRN